MLLWAQRPQFDAARAIATVGDGSGDKAGMRSLFPGGGGMVRSTVGSSRWWVIEST